MCENRHIQHLLFMLAAFAIYSSAGVFSKYAAQFRLLSTGYFICLGCTITVLGVYAIMWQIILKHLPLTTAFLWKNVCIIFGLLYSYFLFHEPISANNLIGISIILIGLIILTPKK